MRPARKGEVGPVEPVHGGPLRSLARLTEGHGVGATVPITITPDLEIELTSSDYFAGVDRVLERVLASSG